MTGKRVAGKAAIITGGARGIGKATALRLAEEGAGVAVFDILDDGEAVAAEIRAAGGTAMFAKVDLTVEAQVKSGVAAAAASLGGRIDILVNNAAIPGVNKLVHEIAVEEWDQVFDINVKGKCRLRSSCPGVIISQRCPDV